MFLIAQTIKIDVLHMEQSVKCQVIRPTCQVELYIMSRFFSFPPSSNNPLHEHGCYIVKLLFSEASEVLITICCAQDCLPDLSLLSPDQFAHNVLLPDSTALLQIQVGGRMVKWPNLCCIVHLAHISE